jgi:hypothetical protein
MNRTQALAKVKKLLGPKAVIEVHDKALVGDARETARAEYVTARDRLADLTAARDARRLEVLRADAEYQRLKRETAEAEKAMEQRRGAIYHRRVRVKIDKGWCYSVESEGDNFDEALAELEAKRAAA